MAPKKTPVNTLQNNQAMQLKESPHPQRRTFYPAPGGGGGGYKGDRRGEAREVRRERNVERQLAFSRVQYPTRPPSPI